MFTSDNKTAIIAALLKAQKALKNPRKDSKNPHFKNTYASLTAVLEAIKPVLIVNELLVAQTLDVIQGTTVLETIVFHVSGEFIASRMAVTPAKADPQGVAGAITYARRYSLLALFNLATEDDDGNDAAGLQQAPHAHPIGAPSQNALPPPPAKLFRPGLPTTMGQPPRNGSLPAVYPNTTNTTDGEKKQ